MKFQLSLFLLFACVITSFGQFDTRFTSVGFPAQMNDPFTGRITEVYSVLDEDYNTHIAWIRDDGTSRDVMYSIYDNKTVRTFVVSDDPSNEIKRYPTLVLDANKRPHLSWFVKRDDSQSCCPSGNYAVMYGGDPEGDGSFTVSQVSTNPLDPTSNTATEYTDAYVNHSPTIFLDASGSVNIAYYSDTYSSISFEQYLVIATKSGSSWNLNEALVMDGINIYSQDYPVLPKQTGSSIVGIALDISPDDAELFFESGGEFQRVSITNNPDHDVKHAQTFIDKNDQQHLFYFDDNSTEQKLNIYHYGVSVGTFSFVEKIAMDKYSPSNFTYVAYDEIKDEFVYVYRAFNGEVGAYGQRLSYPELFGNRAEMDLSYADALGERALNVHNGFISLVTGSLSKDSLYITTNTLPNGGTSGPVLSQHDTEELILYPNPTSRYLHVQTNDLISATIFDLAGKALIQSTDSRIDLVELKEGTYIIELDLRGSKKVTGRIQKAN